MLVKFWDLDTRHCFKTIVSHRSEVNDLILLNDCTRLLTGCHDNEIRVFELTFKDSENDMNDDANKVDKNNKKLKLNNSEMSEEDPKEDAIENDESSLSSILDCKLIGSLIRESKDPLSQLCTDNTGTLFSSHSANEKHVEIYKINTDDEIKKKLAKRLKKQKRKLATDVNEQNGENGGDDYIGIERTVADEFTRLCLLKFKHKIKSVDLHGDVVSNLEKMRAKKSIANMDDDDDEILGECKIACLLQNNQTEVYLLKINKQINKIQTPELIFSIEMPGHRTDVRTLCFSSDSTAFVSASGDSMKVWNRMSLNCIRTFKCDYALSSLFLADDNHVLIGTKVINQIIYLSKCL